MRKYLIPVLLILSLIVGFVPRFIELFNNFDYLTPEPAIDYMSAKKIAVDHILPTVGYAFGGNVALVKPLWDITLAIPFFLTDGHPFSLKIMMFLISISCIPITFFLFNKLLNKRIALLITMLVATSPILIEYSGKIAPPFIVPLIIIFFLYSMLNFFSGRPKFVFLASICVGLVAHLEIPAAMLLTAMHLPLIGYFVYKNKLNWKQFALSFLVIFVVTIPIFALAIYQNSISTPIIKSIGTTLLSPVDIVSKHFETFTWNFRSSIIPNLYLSIIIAFVGMYATWKMRKDKKISKNVRNFSLYLLVSPIFFFLLTLLYPFSLSGWWLSFIVVFYCVWLGISLEYLLSTKYKLLALGLIFTIFILFGIRTARTYSLGITFPHKLDVIRTYKIVEYINSDSGGKNYSYNVLSSQKPDNISYDYDAMFWWIAKYEPKKASINYIIIEPEYKNLSKNEQEEIQHSSLLKEFPDGVRVFKFESKINRNSK